MRRLMASLLAVGMLSGASAASAETLKIGTGEYAPYTDSTAADNGTVNRIVAKMAKNAGLTVEFAYMPWMRALELARQGRFHATSYWLHSQEREADFIHVGPIFQDNVVFFRLADTDEPAWSSLEELSAFRMGAVTGYTYTSEFWEMAEDGRLIVEEAPSDEASMRKLMAGRIDLHPMSKDSGFALIERLFTPEEQQRITVFEKPLVVTDGFLLVSRATENAEDLAARLQEALGSIETASQ